MALDDAGGEQPVTPTRLILPELGGEADVGGDAALDRLTKGDGEGADGDHVDHHLIVVEKDGQVAEAELGPCRRRHREPERRCQQPESRAHPTHTADRPL
jgi:hypothetical protein